jgi:phosphotransferase system enzyme I (PtsP)
MVGTGQGPRVLLRRMREVMARPEAAQARLDRIVSLIAANMVAEVCSIYVMRPTGNVLELFASEGLKAEAVHQSTLKLGEGLVGVIAHDAKPLSLSDAQSHPAFKYLPETGEEIYSSFLGVPILRHGVVSGVLVVQNQVQAQLYRGRRRGPADSCHGSGRGDRHRRRAAGAVAVRGNPVADRFSAPGR